MPSSEAAVPAALEWVGLHSTLGQPIAQLWPRWPGATDPAQLGAAPCEPVSTWIWPAIRCQVCIPTLSKLLGERKGNPHTEAFHSHDLARCRLSPSCLKFLLGLFCCDPLDWASSAYQNHYPALVRYFPNIWMRQVFLLALGTRVGLGSHSSKNRLSGIPETIPRYSLQLPHCARTR